MRSYKAKQQLLDIYDTFYKYCFNKFDFVNESDISNNQQ